MTLKNHDGSQAFKIVAKRELDGLLSRFTTALDGTGEPNVTMNAQPTFGYQYAVKLYDGVEDMYDSTNSDHPEWNQLTPDEVEKRTWDNFQSSMDTIADAMTA
jgi:hypothetical protein